ncbi:ABC transporter ATP-binding protein [Faecalimonas umbilicata]|uniref:ABC transporter ATP-binding protein n=1 Tax=Faecalimonas umbilicata TaxID=1912855 RepID=UPI000E40CCBD|nr:ABC transporter ATP-binding protein [Faecalimonas umbilicata]RGC78503.1 ABC transporter ATP-binding protein [Lachnospiraceae bacterium AM25-17]RJU66729.1 ABC transporter ATP-binding protein [Coprococcus sp. AM27-12LB]
MGKLFKFMKPYAATILMIVVFLVLQAYCDLSLPGYTSDIVNVGIQQGGIDTAIPEQISVEDMDRLFLFVSEQDQKTVLDAYERDTDTYESEAYVLKDGILKDEKRTDKIGAILSKPMMLVTVFSSDSEETKEMTDAMFASLPKEMLSEDMTVFDVLGMMPEEQRAQMVTQIGEKVDEMPETMLEQAATIYLKEAYKNLGMDTDKIQTGYMLRTGGKMLALAAVGMIVSMIVGFLASKVGASTGRDLRGKVFRKVVEFSNGEFDKFSTASLITRSTNDIQQIQMLTVMILRMVLYAPIMGMGGVFKVFHTNVSMSWIIGLAVVLIAMVVMVLFVVAMPKFKILQNLVDRLNLVTREILTGLPVIRAFSTEKHEEERFDQANKDLTKTNLFVNRAMTFMMPTMMLIMNAISILIVWVGANGINDGQMQVGDMMAFIQYTMQIIMAFLMICMISIMLPRAAVSATRVDEVLTSTTLINDPKQPKHLKEGKGMVEFNHVSFRYPGAEEDVLHDISFTAKPGETTAIIGSTGSGKSTMVNLIPRFYDVTEGKITIDGEDIRNVTQHELRDQLGYVPQKGVLFSGTIASNILYGNPDGSEETMMEAAKVAQAAEFIEEKSKCYDSRISQGGGNVSGGQKQRLSIARAIAKDPKIFIFDDSFSALDYKTDVTLRKALKEHTVNSTVIIVAQRISTILHADQIIVLDEGKVAGIGTHKELLKNCDVYYQIAASQLSEKELERDLNQDEQEGGR